MKDKKIIIAGGSGFIGQEMTKYFGRENKIIILSRKLQDSRNNRNEYNGIHDRDALNYKLVKWDGKTQGDWVKELDAADMVINLAGKTVNCRYTKKNKSEIMNSRTNAVEAIGKAISQCATSPKVWINASSATIYRHAEDKPQDEYNGEFCSGFSVEVCKRWEKTFFEQLTPLTRKVNLRMAITLGPGGVLIPYFNLLKIGLGGKQGSGKQMYSWVHIEDTCRMIEWIADHETIEGTYNCCSPNPVANKKFMELLRKETGKGIGLTAYEWMLKAGAVLIGTETELVLKSRWVVPTRIIETGFTFKFPFLQEAFADIIAQVPRKQYQLL